MTQNGNVIRLVTSAPARNRVCATCRYRIGYREYPRCAAVDLSCCIARIGECRAGALWQPRLGALERFRTWLYGGGN